MGLLDALKQYVADSMPGGLLNPEFNSTNGQKLAAELQRGLLESTGINARDKRRAWNKNQLDAVSGSSDTRGSLDKQAYETAMNMAGMAPMGIVSPAKAMTLNIGKSLPTDDLFNAAVAGTKGASVTDDGLRMMIQRNQLPEQGMEPSVRGGVFYLPEGAAQQKHYSTGRNGYGGNEKIAGETLIRNPLFVKGATGGKAPEAAYDSLIGKGAYQAMRNDALKAYGGYGANISSRVSAIEKFLDSYAPELKDQAEYIAMNSKQGNQLAYALQEAAVASAVRKAGNDAVLGYSKGKKGPFISEVFDVRESHYPDRFGGSEVWPGLLQSQPR
jgi:hypothetical protein